MTTSVDRIRRGMVALAFLLLFPAFASAATDIQGQASFSPEEIRWGSFEGYDTLQIPGFETDGPLGCPELPGQPLYYLLPDGYDVADLVVERAESRVDENVRRPMPGRASDWRENGIREAPQVYDQGSDFEYPAHPVELLGVGTWAGRRIAQVMYHPVSWRPARQQIVYHTKVAFTLHLRPLDEDSGVARRARPAVTVERSHMDERLAELVENPPAAAPTARSGIGSAEWAPFRPSDYPSLDGSRVEYLIITDDAFADAFQALADWRTQTGFPAVVRTISWIDANVHEGTDLAEKIRVFIRDAYQRWGTTFVLLGGDTDVIPPRYVHVQYYFDEGEYIPTDLYYAALDGSWDNDGDGIYGEGAVPAQGIPGDSVDLFPEVDVGRAPVNTVGETQIFIDKTKRYRTQPITDQQTKAAFLAEVIFPFGWEWPDTNGILANGCDLAYDLTQYVTLPSWDTVMVCEYPHRNMNYTSVKAALNSGYGLLTVITHGDPFKISSSDGKYVRIDDFQALSNNNKFSIYYYSNCSTGQYDAECLNEAALFNPVGGSVASIAPTRLEFPLVSIKYMKEFYRLFYQTDAEYMGELSELHRVPLVTSAVTEGQYRWVHFSQLMMGDPALMVWKSLPGSATVSHAGSMTVADSVYTVGVSELGTPIEDALVVLWNSASGDYARGRTDASGQVTLPFHPTATGSAKLTVTHPLFRTREATVTVGAGSAARLRVAGVSVDDDDSGLSSGNGNGVAEAGERIELGVTLTNVGAGDATGVSGNLLLGEGAHLTLDVTQGGVRQPDRVWLGAENESPGALPITIGMGGDTLSIWGHPHYIAASRADSGSYFWQDLSGWHLRFASGVKPHAFAGSLSTDGTVRSALGLGLESGDVVNVAPNLVTFAVNVDSVDFEDGIDFVLDDSSHVSLLVPAADFGDIAAGDSATSLFLVESGVATPDLHQARMDLSLTGTTAGTVTWPEGIRFEVSAPDLFEEYHAIDDSTLGGNGDGDLDVGETVILASRVRNSGHGTAGSVQGVLRAVSGITVIDSTDTFGDIAPGALVAGSGDFRVLVDSPGSLAAQLELTDADGRSWTETMELEVPTAPTGLSTAALMAQIPNSISLRWTGSTSPDIWGYNIYRSKLSTTGYTRINEASVEREAFYLDRAVMPESTYYYRIAAVDSAGNESRRSTIRAAVVRPPFQAGWPRTTEGTIWSSPLVTDLNEDSDGDFEVLVGSEDGYLYVFDDAGNLMPGWPRHTGDEVWASPAVGNLDDDDAFEIVIGSNDKKLYAFNYDGTGLTNPDGTFYTTSAQIRSTPTLADLDGDGDLEVIFGNSSGRVYALRHDGTPYMGSAIFAAPGGGGATVASPTVADLDGNGDLEVLFPQLNTGKVYAYNHDKTGYLDSTGVFATLPASVWASLAVGDIDNNGIMDVVAATWGGRIYAWNKDAVALPGWPRSTDGARIWGSPALGDMDGDGDLEVAVGSSNDSLYVLRPDGTNLPGWPQVLGDSTWSSPCLGDITGDGRPEVIVECMDGYVYAFQYTGVPVPGWPIPTTERDYGSGPTICDLDRDGDVEVLAGTYDGRIYCWDVGKAFDPSPSAIPWPTFAHDTYRTGWFDQPFTEVAGGAVTVLPASFGMEQNVPNPFNPRTVIRYRLADEAPVSLTIYDVRGRLVKRLVGGRQPAGFYEVAWRGEDEKGNDSASGVYFYRLEAGEKTFSRKMILVR